MENDSLRVNKSYQLGVPYREGSDTKAPREVVVLWERLPYQNAVYDCLLPFRRIVPKREPKQVAEYSRATLRPTYQMAR